MSLLKEIRSLFNVVVSWSFYNNSGITQCSNCQNFGHGSSNCFLLPSCVKCGGSHQTKSCPLDKEKKDGKIPMQKLCCVNCFGHHTANYQNCPARQQYISNQSQRKGDLPKRVNRNHFKEAPELNNVNFPFLNKNQPAWKNSIRNNQLSPSNFIEKDLATSNSAELFSPQECFKIFNEFVSKLTISALIAIKHVTTFFMKIEFSILSYSATGKLLINQKKV